MYILTIGGISRFRAQVPHVAPISHVRWIHQLSICILKSLLVVLCHLILLYAHLSVVDCLTYHREVNNWCRQLFVPASPLSLYLTRSVQQTGHLLGATDSKIGSLLAAAPVPKTPSGLGALGAIDVLKRLQTVFPGLKRHLNSAISQLRPGYSSIPWVEVSFTVFEKVSFQLLLWYGQFLDSK